MEYNHVLPIQKVAFIGNYVPRRCGIATFTSDICRGVLALYPRTTCLAIAVNDIPEGYEYPRDVRFEISEEDVTSYQRAAEYINLNNVDVVNLQHEFGIFGGPSGSHILSLLNEVKVPIVTTLHTVLNDPSNEQRNVMDELKQISSRFIVMTDRAFQFLVDIYNIPEEKIDIIPHGIPDMPFVDPNYYKDTFGVEGKQVLLTFGLLSPNKGIEFVLNALPGIIEKHPNVVYIVLGATHPNLIRQEGEAYRLSLERLAIQNDIEKNVIFYNRYVELNQLIEFISASDIYITPYLTESQIVSGTLAYCFGSGKAVVSTPYWHATELLEDNRGVLVPFSDSSAITEAINELLSNEIKRHTMRKNAYKLGREMIWSSVAHQYMKSFEKSRINRRTISRNQFSVKTLAQQGTNLPKFKFDHLLTMMDSVGMYHHATYGTPNYIDGYYTDDNARCLILTVLLEKLGLNSKEIDNVASRCLAFLNYAFNFQNGRFRTYLTFDRKWPEVKGSEDAHGRALWALGTCIGMSEKPNLQKAASQIWEEALHSVDSFKSIRAWAFILIGIDKYLERLQGDSFVTHIRDSLINKLIRKFRDNSSDDWEWFEDTVSDSNAKISHALILYGKDRKHLESLEIGLKSLKWLLSIETSENNCFRPIGYNGYYRRYNKQTTYDQRPIEIYAMVSSCIDAYLITKDESWLGHAHKVFDWFLGINDLGAVVYDPESGGCRDALHVDRVNENQGAESTLAFLLSLAEMQLLQNKLAAFNIA